MKQFRFFFFLSALALLALIAVGLTGARSAEANDAVAAAPPAVQEATPEPFGERTVPETAAAVATPGGTLSRELTIELEMVADGLNDPINVVSANEGSGRLFVVERPGTVRVIEDGELLDEPFLDISGNVLSAFLEQGLYDIAFHPDFAENGRFFIHYAEMLRNGDSMIVEYQVSEDNPNAADPESARAILQIDQPYANHNGGELAFGPDGYLYIGSGDGGWEGDPLEAGESINTLLGKILRIDVDSGNPYAIPEDNPFAGDLQPVELFGIDEETFAQIHTEARPEIWAYGLRNPWKFSFDPATGDLFIAEVGQNVYEEIDYWPAGSDAGVNYGWDFMMGTHCFPASQEECPTVGTLPIAEYEHSLGSAVIGLGVYRGEEFPELDGVYFAGDYGSGRIWGLAPDADGQWQMEELLDTDLMLTSGGAGEDGSLYVTSCQCAYGQQEMQPGAVWRLVSAAEDTAEAEATPSDTAEVNRVDVGLVEFDILMPEELPAGPTEFTITNEGSRRHNFRIEGPGVSEGFDTNLTPGETRTLQVDLEPGTYDVWCPIPGHRSLGMELELTVTDADG